MHLVLIDYLKREGWDDLKITIKGCVHYFLRNVYFSPNGSPSKTIKDVFYFIWSFFGSRDIRFVVFPPSPLFLPVSHCLRAWSKINLQVYDTINCLNKNLLTRFICYLEKKKRYDIETWVIDTLLHKEHFHGKIIQKMCTESLSQTLFLFW